MRQLTGAPSLLHINIVVCDGLRGCLSPPQSTLRYCVEDFAW